MPCTAGLPASSPLVHPLDSHVKHPDRERHGALTRRSREVRPRGGASISPFQCTLRRHFELIQPPRHPEDLLSPGCLQDLYPSEGPSTAALPRTALQRLPGAVRPGSPHIDKEPCDPPGGPVRGGRQSALRLEEVLVGLGAATGHAATTAAGHGALVDATEEPGLFLSIDHCPGAHSAAPQRPGQGSPRSSARDVPVFVRPGGQLRPAHVVAWPAPSTAHGESDRSCFRCFISCHHV